jgi:hypothetical protein
MDAKLLEDGRLQLPDGRFVLMDSCEFAGEWREATDEEAAAVRKVLPEGLEFDKTLMEGKSKGLVARGTFGHVDTATANGRVYTGKLMNREIHRLGEGDVKNRSCMGLLDHPKDGKTSLKEVSHLITDLRLDGNAIVGEAFILPTPNGSIIKNLVESGVNVGISSRGVGSTVKGPGGKDIVQDDYRLMTFDFVSNPAAAGAYPKFQQEDTQGDHTEDAMDYETLKKENPDLFKQIQDEALASAPSKDQIAESLRGELTSMVVEQQAEALEQARSEALSDPQTAGARMVVEKFLGILKPYMTEDHIQEMLEAKDVQISDLQEKLSEAAALADSRKEELEETAANITAIARKYYMADELLKLEDFAASGRIVSLMGDPSRFKDSEEFKTALSAAVEQGREEHARAEEESEEVARLREERDKANETRDKALVVAQKCAARAYAENRLSAHPQAPAIREMIEANNVNTTQDVDSIIEAYQSQNPSSPEFDHIRESVGADTETSAAGGLSHLLEGLEDFDEVAEDMGATDDGADEVGLEEGIFGDALMEEVAQLSGLPPKKDEGGKDIPY